MAILYKELENWTSIRKRDSIRSFLFDVNWQRSYVFCIICEGPVKYGNN